MTNDPRPNWDEWGLSIARAVATRADCSRRQVGAVLVRDRDHKIMSTGYNGAPPHQPGCLTAGACPRGQRTFEEVPSYEDGPTSYDLGPGACIALHAEQNALLRASWDDMVGCTLYVTCQPCEGCSRMISGTPILRVVWP